MYPHAIGRLCNHLWIVFLQETHELSRHEKLSTLFSNWCNIRPMNSAAYHFL